MQPFVDVRLTKRLQYDFTDISTSPVTRRWAQIDPRVLYIEDPHPRAVRDANRARPDDLLPGLREAFARLDAGGPDGRPSLVDVDAVRPVTFGYLPVYTRPQTDEDWERLGDALRRPARSASTSTSASATTSSNGSSRRSSAAWRPSTRRRAPSRSGTQPPTSTSCRCTTR